MGKQTLRNVIHFSVLMLVLCMCPVSTVQSGEVEDRRIAISLSIFPRVVAVDKDLDFKLTKDGEVRFLLVYDKDREKAELLANSLTRKITNLRGKPVVVAVEDVRNISLIFPERAAAMLITERFGDVYFDKLIRAGISEQITVFSPFAGDVERGATVGLAIGNRVMPYFNINTLRASKVNINSRLLSLSKIYE